MLTIRHIHEVVCGCHSAEITERLDRIERLLRAAVNKENIIMTMGEDLIAAVTRCETASQGILAYLSSLPPNTTVAEAITRINADADALNAAIPANLTTPPTA